MAKLFSHHDRLHIHAVLGFSALLHFSYRFLHLFVVGGESFRANWTSAALLGIHFLLHFTSFQFEIPKNRLWTKPMIWREFRVHNAIFAYRNLIGAALGIILPEWWLHSPFSASSLFAKVALVLATVWAADIATEKLGSREKRTTNAMPYPPGTNDTMQRFIKRFYAKAQFAATALAICGTPTLAFGSVLAIECASFLMTLVRKGVVSATCYHALYGLALFVMFPSMFVVMHGGDWGLLMSTWRGMCVAAISSTLRVGRVVRLSKWSAWCTAIVPGILFAEAAARFVNPLPLAWLGALWSIQDTAMELVLASRAFDALAKDGKPSEEPGKQAEGEQQETNPNEAPQDGAAR